MALLPSQYPALILPSVRAASREFGIELTLVKMVDDQGLAVIARNPCTEWATIHPLVTLNELTDEGWWGGPSIRQRLAVIASMV